MTGYPDKKIHLTPTLSYPGEGDYLAYELTKKVLLFSSFS
jgi:hypothetical protein